ncbi:MAG: hypothetical protein ACLFPU_10205 [Dehalococcoidia bacterium]
MKQIIKNDNFRKVAVDVKPDAKKRIVLSKAPIAEGVTYHIYCNEIGQIVLDPHVSIPASEVWLYQNREALEAVQSGIQEAAEGNVTRIDLNDL